MAYKFPPLDVKKHDTSQTWVKIPNQMDSDVNVSPRKVSWAALYKSSARGYQKFASSPMKKPVLLCSEDKKRDSRLSICKSKQKVLGIFCWRGKYNFGIHGCICLVYLVK